MSKPAGRIVYVVSKSFPERISFLCVDGETVRYYKHGGSRTYKDFTLKRYFDSFDEAQAYRRGRLRGRLEEALLAQCRAEAHLSIPDKTEEEYFADIAKEYAT